MARRNHLSSTSGVFCHRSWNAERDTVRSAIVPLSLQRGHESVMVTAFVPGRQQAHREFPSDKIAQQDSLKNATHRGVDMSSAAYARLSLS